MLRFATITFFVAVCLFGIGVNAQTLLPFSSGSGSGGGGACASGVLDTNAASPGAWTVALSLRKTKAAYAGSAIRLQRTSDNATLDIGFTGCDLDTTSANAFCSTVSFAAGSTSSARAGFPTGSIIYVFNAGPQPFTYSSGNGTVTVAPATNSTNYLLFNEMTPITVGANTNLAAIVGTGYGINGNAGAATVFMTNCAATIIYDQTANANNVTQATQAKQLAYIPPSITGGKAVLAGCLTCGMKAADSATYKTSTVETFTVMSWGDDIISAGFNYAGVVYPSTGTSNASVTRWGLVNNGNPDLLTNNINGSNVANGEGFGNVWRGQNLTQFDYSTGGITRWNGGTQFLNTGSGTPTYPTAVGLYVMGDAAGNGTPGMFAETLIASGTQTARNTVSANQVSYWGITTGAAESVALTNPLGDGWNWNQVQLGGFAPSPPGVGAVTVNGNPYFSEGAWNSYSQWRATNGSTASGQLGDKLRFQINGLADQWDGTFRSEVDGASGSAQFNIGTDFWIAYAVFIEPGTSYHSQWNITGQMHTVAGPVCCIFNIESNSNSTPDIWVISTFNGTSGAQTANSSSFAITRGRWYHFVFHVVTSTSGSTDAFDLWLDTVTAGTMVHAMSVTSGSGCTGGTCFGGDGTNNAAYWKYGIYRETGNNLPTFAIDYGNMQVCSTGAGCTAKYGTTDLSAQTTTPLADPAHM